MATKEIQSFVEKKWQDSIVPTLQDYITIPNKSPDFDKNWQENGYMEKAAQLLADWAVEHGPADCQVEIVRLDGHPPLIFIDVPGELPSTCLMYGHYDKQPEFDGWLEDLGPWKPVIRDDKLYGRGGADDGYAIFSSLTAISAIKHAKGKHPRCVIMIEGAEESGSPGLLDYLHLLKSRFEAPDLIVCLDSGAGNYDQLWLTSSLRGMILGDLKVSMLSEGVHSGSGGVVPSCFRILRQLLERVEDSATGEIVFTGLQSEIPEEAVDASKNVAQVLGSEILEKYPFLEGTNPQSKALNELLLDSTWRTSLAVTGIDGIPNFDAAGNVLHPYTSAKLCIRLPPNLDSQKALEGLTALLLENTPYDAKVTFTNTLSNDGWVAPKNPSELDKLIIEASEKFFGKPAVTMSEGGTIPFLSPLSKVFPDAKFCVTGVLGPNSNAHGPNEFLHLPAAQKLTCCISYILANYRP